MNYWLLKSEPNTYSWMDLKREKKRTVAWEGVRSYYARKNLMEIKEGDLAFFYHSVVKPQTIMGIVEVVKNTYPDPTQFDKKSDYYDPRSSPDDPRWFMIDVKYRRDINPPITREELKGVKKLRDMALFQNTRLSVQPVTESEWETILELRF